MNFVSLLCFLYLCVISLINCETECPTISTIEDRRTNKKTLRIVQYNAEWLFVDYYSNANCPGSNCPWHTIDEAKKHLIYVANVTKILNPDIINICEVEGCDELNMLKEQLDDSFKPYLKKGTDTSTGQNVGFLTKIDPLITLYRSEEKVVYPISGSKCGQTTASGTTGVSKHYITEFKIGEMFVAMIGVHLLAIPTDPTRCVQREGQAQVLQNIVSSYIDKDYEIILIGDMNDFDDEILDINSNKPTSRVLNILKGLDGQKKGYYELENIALSISKLERYSDWWDSDNNCNTSSVYDFSMIDHILVSPKINSRVLDAFIYHGYEEYCGKMNSDHYPVVIDLYTT
jgi:exonuclease III